MELTIQSADQKLFQDFYRALMPWEPKPDGPAAPTARACVVEYMDAAPGWRGLLLGKPLRPVHGGANGPGDVFRAPDGFVVVLARFGAILASSAGELLCLVDDPDGKRLSCACRPGVPPGGAPCNMDTAALLVTAGCLMRRGRLLVHAGGVARDGRCQLWTGPSGSGKSTRVLELVSSGWDFCGDDLVILGKGQDGVWKVWPCRRMVRVSADTCAHLPALSGLAGRQPAGDKHEFDIADFFPVQVPREAVLERICCLDSQDGSPERRLSPAEAIERLGGCFVYMLWPEDAQQVLDSLCEMAETVPVYAVPRGTWRNVQARVSDGGDLDGDLAQLLTSGNSADLRLGLAMLEERPELRAAEILEALARMPQAAGSALANYCQSRFPFFGEPFKESGSLAGQTFTVGERARGRELEFLRGVDHWLASGRPDEKRLAILAGQRALHAEYEGIIGARWGIEAARGFRALARSQAPQVDRQLAFAPTFRCNLACKYCMSAGIEQREADSETARRVVSWAARAGARKLCLFGGEPTFYSGFNHFLSLAREAGLTLYMPSNLVTPEEVIASVRPDLFECVIAHLRSPAATGAHAERFRRNALRLRDAGVKVVLRYNVADEDWGFLLDLAKEIDTDKVAFSVPVERSGGTTRNRGQWLADARLAMRFSRRMLDANIKLVLSRPLPLCCMEDLGGTPAWDVFAGSCGANHDGYARAAMIWPDATVVLCPGDHASDRPSLDRFGGWEDLQAYVGPRMRAWLDQPLWPECAGCYFRARGLCQGACLMAKERADAGSGTCRSSSTEHPEGQRAGGTCR